jgi:multidrug efflux system membrane fusion protein
MVVLNQVSPVRVGFSVREGDLSAVQQGFAAGELKVRAIIPGQEDRPEDGTVTFVNNTVDPTTGTILLKGTFQNADRRLWPGQFVNVVLTLAVQADAIVVPSQAVQLGQQGRFIYVVKPDKTVEATPVEVGREVGPETVIAKGIVPEQVVVTDGQLRLVPGAKVQVQAEGPPAREATP